MRRWAFIVFILGMFLLLTFLIFQSREIGMVEDLKNLESNYHVFIEGEVMSEKFLYAGTKLIKLDNEIELVCECSGILKGKDISVEGIIEDYEGKKQVRVLTLAY